MKTGVLLINLGTPDSLEIKDLRKYLKEFLSDPRVLTMPAVFRWLLLNLIVLPKRPPKIRENYQKIWTKDGSPLALYAKRLTGGVADYLGKNYVVKYAMRYRLPQIETVMNEMIGQGITNIIIVPLFPQFAMATTGSIYAKIFELMRNRQHIPAISFFENYYDKPFFINAQADIAAPYLKKPYDHVIFTYHGLPKDHLTKYNDSGQKTCYKKKNCCASITSGNSFCYKAQCYATSQKLAEALKIPQDKYTVCFQSRFGKAEWIQPYTHDVLLSLAKKKKQVIALCPAFTADCVETLEEINGEEKDYFIENGGKSFDVVPCVNDHPLWIQGLSEAILKVS